MIKNFLLNMIILATIPFVFVLIKVIFINNAFKKSDYKAASGNGVFNTIFDKGSYGEYLTFQFLEKLEGDNKLLTNVYIPKSDGSTTEIDLIMVNKSGIYVFESKNYSGWIFGDERNKNWTQLLKGGKKFRFYNPIWQNKGHISALQKVLPDVGKDAFYSYIIFSERCKLKKITVTTPCVTVIKRNKLKDAVRHDMFMRQDTLSENQVSEIYHSLRVYSLVNDSIKEKHIRNLKS